MCKGGKTKLNVPDFGEIKSNKKKVIATKATAFNEQ
jgi:hypothetical protein